MSVFSSGLRNTKAHRSDAAGLSDLLQYAAEPINGVVTLKHGAYLAAWVYRGDDNASSTDLQRGSVSAIINRELSKLGSGWMIHVDAVRRDAPGYSEPGDSYFPDEVTRAIDEERRRTFQRIGNLYQGAFILTITYQPPLAVETKFVDMMFDDDGEKLDDQARYDRQTKDFLDRIKTLEGNLSTVLKMDRLYGHRVEDEEGNVVVEDDLLSFLQYCITGLTHPVILPDCGMYLDSVLGGQELWTGVVPKIGRNFIQTVAIMGFPSTSTPGMLTALGELACEYRWSTRFIFMDPHEAQSQFDKFRRKWKQKVRGFMDAMLNTNKSDPNEDAQNMVKDANSAKAEISQQIVSYGYYTSVVVLMGENRSIVEDNAKTLAKTITALGFPARVETLNTVEAWLGSLPGHGVENIRRPLINTMNLADLLPTSSVWTGSEVAPCPFYKPNSPALMQCATTGNSPFWLNLHVRDLGHSMIFGPTGSGKSTLLAAIVAQFRRYAGASIFAFDKGHSLYTLCKAAKGQHFAVGGDNDDTAYCPLADLSTPGDVAWAAKWLDDCLALQGVITVPGQRLEILRSLKEMDKNGSKSMTDFCSTVQDAVMREALQTYTIDGPVGHLLDAKEDRLKLSQFTVFELEDLMPLGDKYVLPVLQYLFRRIEKSLKGQPAMIVLDEAWLMLQHPVFAPKIVNWLKELRKKNCLVIMATQSLSDAVNSGIFDVIKESCPTKIYLPNWEAKDEETAETYKKMGLNPRQIDIVARAIPKRQYYYVSEQGRRLFDLALGPLALAFTAVSDPKAVAHIKHLEKTHKDEWVDHWLAEKRLRLSDYAGA